MSMRFLAGMKAWFAYLTTKRSPRWPAVRAAHLAREPRCQWCHGYEKLEVHHVEPVHIARDKELAPDNLITLCMAPLWECHYEKGHRGTSWVDFDPDVRAKCAARWRQPPR